MKTKQTNHSCQQDSSKVPKPSSFSQPAGTNLQANHGQESSARKDDVVLTSGVNTDVKILQTPDTNLQANSDKPTLADKEVEHSVISYSNAFFWKKDVKQAIKEIKEKFSKEKMLVSFSDIKLECSVCKNEMKIWARISEIPRKEICLRCYLNNIIAEVMGEELCK